MDWSLIQAQALHLPPSRNILSLTNSGYSKKVCTAIIMLLTKIMKFYFQSEKKKKKFYNQAATKEQRLLFSALGNVLEKELSLILTALTTG